MVKTKKRTPGSGLSAKCVVSPALRCKNSKRKNLNKFVSKIVQEPDSDILKEILEREIFTSTLIKSSMKGDLVDRFITIDSMCNLDFKINKNKEKFIKQNCETESKYKYFLLNMYNGACLNSNKRKSKICGNLSNNETCKYLTRSNESFKSFVKYLIEAILFLHSLKVAHCDIKPLNILCDNKGKIRFIDYGSSFLEDMENGQKEFTKLCKNYNRVSLNKRPSVFTGNDSASQFYNKVAAITPKYTSLEIAFARFFFLKNPDPNVIFSEFYIELILNYGQKDTKELQNLVKKYLKNGSKIINDLFCRKQIYLCLGCVFSWKNNRRNIFIR